jgi:DNA-directed RNA polymerase specialized sigma24 family protein
VTDDELLLAIARNDPDALSALYDRHARIVFATALHVLGDRQRSEDLLHDVFVELVRRARAHHRIERPLRWLVEQVLERARAAR